MQWMDTVTINHHERAPLFTNHFYKLQKEHIYFLNKLCHGPVQFDLHTYLTR